jgi:predicted esterase
MSLLVVASLIGLGLSAAGAPTGEETGLFDAVAVRLPTRLDWDYLAAVYGPRAGRLAADYYSQEQRYQLFVPPCYKPGKSWPLVLFLSPGDEPLGWRAWQHTCEEHDCFFCTPYGAGDGVDPMRRLRVSLDVLDDVRRRYVIDPARTYAAGLGGGARLACTVAFNFPDYFGGVVACGGGAAPFRDDYLRHRAQERLSVAAVTGADDFDRREAEAFLHPLLRDLGVRSRLWVAPGLGHDLPTPSTLEEVWTWLEADLQRRLQDNRLRPGLAVAPGEVPTRRILGERMLAEAEAELHRPDRLFRGVALLAGVAARCDRTDAADRARALLGEIRSDPGRRGRLKEQADREGRRVLRAEARALEGLGRIQESLDTWERLAREQPHTPEAATDAAEIRRLKALLSAAPYLGVRFSGETTVVRGVEPHGPAARAGLRAGNRVETLGAVPTPTLPDLRRALVSCKRGEKLSVGVRRDGRVVSLSVVLGAAPVSEK